MDNILYYNTFFDYIEFNVFLISVGMMNCLAYWIPIAIEYKNMIYLYN